MELIETVIGFKDEADEVKVHLITGADEYSSDDQQKTYLEKIQKEANTAGISLTWELDNSNTLHARHITTDTGWKISLDRGLDIFQRYEGKDAFALANRSQAHRSCKAFEITYIKN